MPYRILKEVSLRNSTHGDAVIHDVGDVLADSQVDAFVRQQIDGGDPHYRSLFEPLSEEQALDDRTTKTATEGSRLVDGKWISPPWPDYVGLSADEIIGRMKDATADQNAQTVLYERGGKARPAVVGFGRSDEATSDGVASTPAQSLRWAANNPGDAEHAAELEDRVTLLESRISAVEQTHSASESEAA